MQSEVKKIMGEKNDKDSLIKSKQSFNLNTTYSLDARESAISK